MHYPCNGNITKAIVHTYPIAMSSRNVQVATCTICTYVKGYIAGRKVLHSFMKSVIILYQHAIVKVSKLN